tara:strand:+ start:3977 stop:5137 length:1161 start_codon:yes stop_codon:yes gene_type:complete
MKHLEILKQLNETFAANFYLVGGFVRDMLSDIHTEDYDIATDLEPEKLLAIAEEKGIRAIPTGIKHGTVTVFLAGRDLEITTFRKDFENNGRHCSVEYTKSIKEDSIRRDFTINALYLDDNNRIFDFHSGQDDLRKGRVRFIGSPEQRINEDYLRMLRFFRFYADFDVNAISLRDEALRKVFAENAHKVTNLSADRIGQEFIKLSKSKNYVKGFAALASFEEFCDIFNLRPNTVNAKDIELIANYSEFIKLTLLYRNNLEGLLACKHFNWSNKQKGFVKALIKAKNVSLDEQYLVKNAVVYSKDVIEFWALAKYLDGDLIKFETLEAIEVLNSELPVFEVTGGDLIELGFTAGPQLGAILKQVKDYWLTKQFPNKQKCLNFARNLL